VPNFARLGHGEEFKAVQAFGVVAEVGRHHLLRLALRVPRLLKDCCLLTDELAGDFRVTLPVCTASSCMRSCVAVSSSSSTNSLTDRSV
jgi:hypothetical protein